MNQHITYINLHFNLIQNNAESSDEGNDIKELNDTNIQKIANPKKVYLLPESFESNSTDQPVRTSKRNNNNAKGE